MNALAKVLYAQEMREIAAEGEARRIAKEIFIEWRDRYAATLCRYIRLHVDAARDGCRLPEPYRDLDWCNAAVQILTNAPEDVVDRFLRANQQTKDTMIRAVIDDGGVTDLNGHFQELPLL